MFVSRFLTVLAIFIFSTAFGQHFEHLEDIKAPADFDNIHVMKLTEDSLQSTFVIWVKKGVKEHFHAAHSENIVVLEGEGMMSLGNEFFMIKAGDYVNIPKGTPHSVTQVMSDVPLKVLSIQSPLFDGSDRIFIEQHQ